MSVPKDMRELLVLLLCLTEADMGNAGVWKAAVCNIVAVTWLSAPRRGNDVIRVLHTF